jgi:hypothetical protein
MAQDFTLDDFRRQLDQVQKLGMNDLLNRLPGTSEMVPDDEDPDVALNRIRQIIDAMTDEERSTPISSTVAVGHALPQVPAPARCASRFRPEFDLPRDSPDRGQVMAAVDTAIRMARGFNRRGLRALCVQPRPGGQGGRPAEVGPVE